MNDNHHKTTTMMMTTTITNTHACGLLFGCFIVHTQTSPDVRVLVGSSSAQKFTKPLRHDDVVVVPELFGMEDDWSIYYQLVEELTQLQKQQVKGSEFISWHEGSHLICKEPTQCKTYQKILARLCEYFDIDASSAGTRFNWYKDSQDWKVSTAVHGTAQHNKVHGTNKSSISNLTACFSLLVVFFTPLTFQQPFHHDSAAFNPKRAKNQNITVGVSFGATRELAFIRAPPEHLQHDPQFQWYQKQHPPVHMYFPQTNNGVFTFGRDVNIHWKHGVNALPPSEQSGKGRISIILWGLAKNVVEEEGSPPLLGSDGQGPHANHNHNHNDRHRRHHPHDHHHNKRRRHNEDRQHGRSNQNDRDRHERRHDHERRHYHDKENTGLR
jgi:hypothetical protein